jgi:hypothetical protein
MLSCTKHRGRRTSIASKEFADDFLKIVCAAA